MNKRIFPIRRSSIPGPSGFRGFVRYLWDISNVLGRAVTVVCLGSLTLPSPSSLQKFGSLRLLNLLVGRVCLNEAKKFRNVAYWYSGKNIWMCVLNKWRPLLSLLRRLCRNEGSVTKRCKNEGSVTKRWVFNEKLFFLVPCSEVGVIL